ncbi:hypothetical protein J6590_060836 [Homalodisca vitripennis]|nr:hypothetical protein J6590_060836 [Homalodisca vitripennis]
MALEYHSGNSVCQSAKLCSSHARAPTRVLELFRLYFQLRTKKSCMKQKHSLGRLNPADSSQTWTSSASSATSVVSIWLGKPKPSNMPRRLATAASAKSQDDLLSGSL